MTISVGAGPENMKTGNVQCVELLVIGSLFNIIYERFGGLPCDHENKT